MNIIFGRDNAEALSNKYTVLELDTIDYGPDCQTVTAFCAVETIPLLDMPRVTSMKNLHENLLIEYRKKNWNYCLQALEHLVGFWNHELDTFYDNLRTRIQHYIDNQPGDDWTGVISKLTH